MGWCTVLALSVLISMNFVFQVDGECRDVRRSCRKYFCVYRSIKNVCRETCGVCKKLPAVPVSKPEKEECKDMIRCSAFYCNIGALKKKCKKTCNLCGKSKPKVTTNPAKETCRDLKKCYTSYCRYNSLKGYCKKTCGLCSKEAGQGNKGTCGRDKKFFIPGMSHVGRIIAGSPAAPHSWVWMVAIYMNGGYICGGSLITPHTVLTAAHCIRSSNPQEYSIVAGDNNRDKDEGTEQEVEVKELLVNQDYDPRAEGYPNDIAIMKLKHNVKLDNNVGLVCLPPQNADPLSYNGDCYNTGWGRIKGKQFEPASPFLMEVKLPPLPYSECKKRNEQMLPSSQLCAGYKNSPEGFCDGDSGGPLVCKKNGKWYLTGIVSWASEFCKSSQLYPVFTKVSHYISWIKRHM